MVPVTSTCLEDADWILDWVEPRQQQLLKAPQMILKGSQVEKHRLKNEFGQLWSQTNGLAGAGESDMWGPAQVLTSGLCLETNRVTFSPLAHCVEFPPVQKGCVNSHWSHLGLVPEARPSADLDSSPGSELAAPSLEALWASRGLDCMEILSCFKIPWFHPT